MSSPLLMGEDLIPMGEDDVIDFLAQYGTVTTKRCLSYSTPSVWLDEDRRVSVLVYRSDYDASWKAFVYLGSMKEAEWLSKTVDLLDVVNTFLRYKNED